MGGRPAQLEGGWLNQLGLEVTDRDWWCSPAAVDQLITLGEALAGRLRHAGF